MRIPFLPLFLTICLWSCNETTVNNPKGNSQHPEMAKENWTPPPPGEIVANYAERVKEEKLNNFYFAVKIKSTDSSRYGIFDLSLGYGENVNHTSLALPKWNDETILRPMIQKGGKHYQCFIGFEANDSTFHELYEVQVDNKNIKMKQTKGYFVSAAQ